MNSTTKRLSRAFPLRAFVSGCLSRSFIGSTGAFIGLITMLTTPASVLAANDAAMSNAVAPAGTAAAVPPQAQPAPATPTAIPSAQAAAAQTPAPPATTTTAASATTTNPTPAVVPAATPSNAVPGVANPADPAQANAADAPAPKLMLKPGQPLVVNTDTEDVQPTDDVNLAREQANHFPDSPEAAFIYAVALTRTSRVEEALNEVKLARKLAQSQGGAAYFDKMINSYEEVLKNSPDDDRIRYGLAWAYYMKAYLLAQDSKRQANIAMIQAAAAAATPTASAATAPTASAPTATAPTTPTTSNTNATAMATTAMATTASAPPAAAPGAIASAPNTVVPGAFTAKGATKKVNPDVANTILKALNPALGLMNVDPSANSDGKKIQATQVPHIPGALEKAAPSAVPQIRQYYGLALKNLDEILAKKPDDVWALVYRWHLYAEETGNLDEAINHWRAAEAKFPSNPGVHFFLGEGYLRKGNLKEAIRHVGQAVMLRGMGM